MLLFVRTAMAAAADAGSALRVCRRGLRRRARHGGPVTTPRRGRPRRPRGGPVYGAHRAGQSRRPPRGRRRDGPPATGAPTGGQLRRRLRGRRRRAVRGARRRRRRTGGPAAAAAAALEPVVTLPRRPPSRPRGCPSSAIDIVGNRRVARDDVLSYLREKPGHLFKVENLTGDVHALWDSGFFEDIQVDLTTNDRGVVLRFIVRERPNIKDVDVRGQRRDRERQAQRGDRDQAEHDPERAGRAPQRAEDQGRLRREGLLPRRRRLRDREPQRENEVIVKFKIVEHQPVTVRRITFIGNEHVSDAELRDQMQTGNGGFFVVRLGRAVPAGRLRARRPDAERALLRQGLPERADRHAARDAHARPRGDRHRDRHPRGPALQDPAAPDLRARQRGPRDRAARRPARAARRCSARSRATTSTAPSSIKDLQAVRTLYRDAGFANVEAEPETELDPVHEQVDIIVPIQRGPPVHIERIEVKGNTKTRDKVIRREMEIQEGQLFSETGLENSKRRITALGYFERVDVSTEQGSAPGQDERQLRGGREADRHVPGRRRASARSRASSPPRRSSRRTCSATGSRSRCRRRSRRSGSSSRCASSSRTSSTRDWSTRASSSTTRSTSSRTSRGDRVGGSLTFGYALIQPWLRLSLTATARVGLGRHVADDHVLRQRRRASSASSSGCRSRTSSTSGRTISLRPDASPTTRATTASSRPRASTSRRRPSSRREAFGSEFKYLRHRFTGRFYYPLGGGTGQPGSGFVLKLNTEVGLITSPTRRACRSSSATSSAASSTCAASSCAASARACRSRRPLDPNSAPIANGANIGGNLEAYENLELEFPIIDKVGIRGVVFFDAGNAWNTEDQFCKTTPAPQFDKVVQPVLHVAGSLGLPAHVDRLRHPLVLAARPAALRVGLPARAAAVREPQRLRVHDRQLLLRAEVAKIRRDWPRGRRARRLIRVSTSPSPSRPPAPSG